MILTDDYPEYGNPASNWNLVCPVVYGSSGNGDFERKHDSPLEDIIPAHSESERGVEETTSKGVETTGNRVKDSHFSQSLEIVRQCQIQKTLTEHTWVTLINMAPMRIHAIRTPAGPPLWRADPEPTNRPVPILPPR